MDFYSDKNNSSVTLDYTEIGFRVYNTIINIIDQFEITYCIDFPKKRDEEVLGVNRQAFNNNALAYIPDLEHLSPVYEDDEVPSVEAILDLIQFAYWKIRDVYVYDTDFYGDNLYAYKSNTNENKTEFAKQINNLFRRNKLIYFLEDNGEITTQLPSGLNELVQEDLSTDDEDLNRIIEEALENIRNFRKEDKQRALEKIWDAYERIKSSFDKDKKKSINIMLDTMSKSNLKLREKLEEECLALTKIGNDFQIRHFEVSKIQINEIAHIEYLFYRVLCVITLYKKMSF